MATTPHDRDLIPSRFLPPSKTSDDFEDIERFGRPLYEVPLFRTRLIPSSLGVQSEDRTASKPNLKVMSGSYAHSQQSAESELPPTSALRRKQQIGPRLRSTSRRSKLHISSSRKATLSCSCCPSKQKLCALAQFTPSCAFCHVEETPKWREGPYGPRTLCNVCGLIYAKREEKARSFLLSREFSLGSSSGTTSTNNSTQSTSPTSHIS